MRINACDPDRPTATSESWDAWQSRVFGNVRSYNAHHTAELVTVSSDGQTLTTTRELTVDDHPRGHALQHAGHCVRQVVTNGLVEDVAAAPRTEDGAVVFTWTASSEDIQVPPLHRVEHNRVSDLISAGSAIGATEALIDRIIGAEILPFYSILDVHQMQLAVQDRVAAELRDAGSIVRLSRFPPVDGMNESMMTAVAAGAPVWCGIEVLVDTAGLVRPEMRDSLTWYPGSDNFFELRLTQMNDELAKNAASLTDEQRADIRKLAATMLETVPEPTSPPQT